MINILKKYKTEILYIIFGGLTTLVNLVTYFVMREVFSVGILASNITAWFLSVVFAFFTNKYFVFENKETAKAGFVFQLVSFFAARLLSGILDTAIVYVFAEKLMLFEPAVKIISNILVIIFNYFASKLVIFKK